MKEKEKRNRERNAFGFVRVFVSKEFMKFTFFLPCLKES